MSNKAIIIAANTELRDYLGNVEKHKEWADLHNGKVFWNLIPPGRRHIPWKNIDIKRGYFYISGSNEIQYKFFIERAGTISEFKKQNLWNNVKMFIPDFRVEQWTDSGYDYFYALLIRNIEKIDPIQLDNFQVINTGGYAQRVMNYIIIANRQTKEVAA